MIAGQIFRCWGRFRNEAGVLVDPTAVSFIYKIGNASATTRTYGDGYLLKEGVGIYYIDLDTTGLPGTWHYRYYSTGTYQTTHPAQTINVEQGVV